MVLMGLNALLASAPLIVFLGAFPLMFDNLNLLNLMNLAITLRMLDIALLGKEIIRELSFIEYVTYMLAFRLPERIKTAELPFQYIAKHTVEYEQVASIPYLVNLVFTTALKFSIYYGVIQRMRRNRADWDPAPMSLASIDDVMDYYLLGLGLSMLMDVMTTVSLTTASLVLRIPYVPMMTSPFLAISVKDFWTKWNLIVQGSLRRIVFDPTMRYIFGHHLPLSAKSRVKPYQTVFAGLMTFLFSALMHEWMIWCCFETASNGEQLVFFLFHGILSIAEVILKRILHKTTGFNWNKQVPWIIQWIGTQSMIAFIAPFFFNHFIREKTYFYYGFA
jgi:hypothetical protein